MSWRTRRKNEFSAFGEIFTTSVYYKCYMYEILCVNYFTQFRLTFLYAECSVLFIVVIIITKQAALEIM